MPIKQFRLSQLSKGASRFRRVGAELFRAEKPGREKPGVGRAPRRISGLGTGRGTRKPAPIPQPGAGRVRGWVGWKLSAAPHPSFSFGLRGSFCALCASTSDRGWKKADVSTTSASYVPFFFQGEVAFSHGRWCPVYNGWNFFDIYNDFLINIFKNLHRIHRLSQQ